MKTYFLFDLDGTLTDPKEGICTSVQYALKAFGIEEPDLDKLEPFIGPPLTESFMKYYGFTEEQALKAKELYRERFVPTGMYENVLYPGIHNMLRSLRDAGMHLAVASSKPEPFVEKILEHFKLRGYFEVVVGSNLDGTRETKSEVVMEALRRLFGDRPIDFDKVYMIGDRSYDIEGAHALRIEAVGVTYGYGSMEELKEAKADYIVRSVEELRKFLLREARELEEEQKKLERSSTGDGRFRFQGGDLWRLIYFFLLFVVVRSIAVSALMVVLVVAQRVMPQGLSDFLFVMDEENMPIASGNGAAICTAFGFIIAALAIRKPSKKMLERSFEKRKLLHLTAEPVSSILLMALLAVGMVLGLNLLMAKLGLLEAESYRQVAETQYSCHIVLGLAVYGLISPLAEELCFRGLIYNYLRELFPLRIALFLSAFLFSFYHGNTVQGVSAFLMGMLLCYAYEYFGTFKAPLAIHVGANLLVYILSRTLFAGDADGSWILCGLALAAAVAALVVLHRRKPNVLR